MKTKIQNQIFVLTFLVCISATIFTACHKGNNNDGGYPQPNPPVVHHPTVTSFAPASAAMNATLTITGTDFSTTLTDNIVTVSGIQAEVISATPTQLTVKVPVHAGDGKITLLVGNDSVQVPGDFKYLYTVTTLAGSGQCGFADGQGTNASFTELYGIAVDANGNVLVADGGNNRIRKITPGGMVTTIAGTGQPGATNGPALSATFNYPHGLCADAAGNIYVVDTQNNLVRKISTNGMVSTIAGSSPGTADGKGTSAQFSFPTDVVVDPNGVLWVSDGDFHYIRKIATDGTVTTLCNFNQGFPEALTLDAAGNIYVANAGSSRIQMVTPAGIISNFSGSGHPGLKDGSATEAMFFGPEGIAMDKRGNFIIGDLGTAAVRLVKPDGSVRTIAGGQARGYADGPGTTAVLHTPAGVAIDQQGNIYVADAMNFRVRKLQ